MSIGHAGVTSRNLKAYFKAKATEHALKDALSNAHRAAHVAFTKLNGRQIHVATHGVNPYTATVKVRVKECE